jgi:hypothetical protein
VSSSPVELIVDRERQTGNENSRGGNGATGTRSTVVFGATAHVRRDRVTHHVGGVTVRVVHGGPVGVP